MTILATTRPRPSAIRQWWVLTGRVVRPTLRNGELAISVAMSASFSVNFYLPLRQVMGPLAGGSYAQYLMPLIALQAVYFAAMMGALQSSTDAVQGVNRRFGSMPIYPLTPLAARMSASMLKCATGLATAIACGYVIGFRFHGSALHTVGFCVLVLLIGVVLSFVGDLIGLVSTNPEATTPILLAPEMILALLSVGIQPAAQFPGWIQPFVRNQPFSVFVEALQALAGDGGPTWRVIVPALAWLAGIVVVAVPLYLLALGRRR